MYSTGHDPVVNAVGASRATAYVMQNKETRGQTSVYWEAN